MTTKAVVCGYRLINHWRINLTITNKRTSSSIHYSLVFSYYMAFNVFQRKRKNENESDVPNGLPCKKPCSEEKTAVSRSVP